VASQDTPGQDPVWLFLLFSQDRRAKEENARLYEEISRRGERMEVLSVITRYLTTIRDVEQLMPRIVGAASELMEADGAGLRFIEGDEMPVAARVGVAETVLNSNSIKIGESLLGRVVAEDRVIAVADVERDMADFPSHQMRAQAAGVRSLLAVPLRSFEGTVGAMVVYFTARREFSQEEISLLSAFADQAALAFQNARLFAETRRQKTELEQILNSTSDGIVTVDLTGSVVSANRRAGELLGLAGSAAGCPLEVLGLNAADAGRIEEEFAPCLPSQGARERETSRSPSQSAGCSTGSLSPRSTPRRRRWG
jgi:transcriptional regulator with GAF, ATPase, and Fis domain